MSRKKKTALVIVEIIAISMSMTILVPLYMIVVNSFKAKGPASLMELAPVGLNHAFENYSRVFEVANLLAGYKNSIILSSISVFFIVVLTSVASFVLQRRGKGIAAFFSSIIVLGLTLPLSIVTTVFILKLLRLNGTFTGFILIQIAINTSFTFFIYNGFYKGVSRYLDESAIIDGCGPIRLFFGIIFPLVKPVTITAIIINFMNIWNDLTISLYVLGKPSKYTVVQSTYMFFGQRTTDWNYIFADIVMVSLPVIIVYFILQKYIVSGMTAGALKG